MRVNVPWLVALSIAAATAPQIGSAQEGTGVLRFHGSNTVGEKLAPALFKAFVQHRDPAAVVPDQWNLGEIENERFIDITSSQPDMPKKVWVKAHGSGTSAPSLKEGKAEVGMSSRRIQAKELVMLAAFGDMTSPDAEHIVALDGLAVFVHPSNPIQSLTVAQVQSMFTCAITNWDQVGGPSAPITLYARDDKSGTYDTFKAMVLQKEKLCPSAHRFESSGQLSDSVAADPNAIGFSGLAYIRSAKPLSIKACNVSYDPSTFAVKTEEYPLARRLYMYTPPRAVSPFVKDFLAYAQTDKAQGEVAKVEFVDLNIEESSSPAAAKVLLAQTRGGVLSAQNPKVVRDYVAFTDGAKRLSVTFRFPAGTTVDGRAHRDLERLANYMKREENKNRKLLLLGFADASGPYGPNQKVSMTRAKLIADELNKLGVKVGNDQLFAGGEEIPVACDDEAGRQVNRRVEVWIK